MNETAKRALSRLFTFYGKAPAAIENLPLLKEYGDLLDGVDADLLTQAVDRLLKTRESPFLPVPGEILRYVRAQRAAVPARRASQPQGTAEGQAAVARFFDQLRPRLGRRAPIDYENAWRDASEESEG